VLIALLLVSSLAAPSALAQSTPETSPDRRDPGELPKPELKGPPVEEVGPGRSFAIFPIPVIYSDPNIGFGFGLMPVLLLQSEKRIDWIIAPSGDYNDIVGAAVTSRVYFYPTPREELVLYNSESTGPNLEHSAQFRGRDRFFYGTDLFARGYFIVDATRRFFGTGSDTKEDMESDYQLDELGVEGEFGYRFFDVLTISGSIRYRETEVRRGLLDDVPDTVALYSSANGVGDGEVDVLAYGGRLVLDLRDDAAIPNDGLYAEAWIEFSARGIVSDTRYERWGATIAHHLPIIRPGRFVHVMRARYAAIEGDDAFPFWELPALGGSDNLRGFGAGRFTGAQALVISVEERVRFHEMVIYDNPIAMELAPFLDVGRVFGKGDPLDHRNWQAVPGMGMRLLVPDSAIVARLDIGIPLRELEEGPAIFITLGYPF
jgi:hypothetical protein